MDNKQQTSVDYYSKEIGRLTSDLITGKITGKQFVMLEIQLLEQAKVMEKERMLECYLKADVFPRKYEFEKWYNETYGGGEQ
jgi:hypothetical protein